MGVALLSLVLVLGNVFKEMLDLLLNHNVPIETIFAFIAFVLPFSMTFTIPWGFLTAVLLVFGRLSADNEVLTPDSSRFWPADQYQPGRGQPSFDKQFVRDYLETLDWNKTPPGPMLPPEVVAKTTAKYLEAYERLTGKKL